MKKTILILNIVFFLSCVKMAVRPQIENEKIYLYDFEKVWPAILEVLSENRIPVDAIEKASGFISTKRVTFLDGEYVNNKIKEYVSAPTGLFIVYTSATYTFTFLVKAVGKNSTRVKFITSMEVWDNDLESWYEGYSTGVIEKQYFDEIAFALKK